MDALAASDAIDTITLTDSTTAEDDRLGKLGEKLRIVGCAPLIAETIRKQRPPFSV